ncbi:MAG: hypothetical protein JWQ32_2579 [Marmoricola sp.]|nr:hypothetical protein [Marmoricola sp.]
MTISVNDCVAAITSHTRGLAAAADDNLTARIEHCPDWSMGDLVWHLSSVHWFWNEIATRLPLTEPDDLVRPKRPAEAELIPTLLSGVEVLADTLRRADQQAPCWTWGRDQNVWFITRHQVQEAAVHHWDAVNASHGQDWAMDHVMATDAIEEFLTHSIGNPRWPVSDAAPLGATFNLPGTAFAVADGVLPGTLDRSTAVVAPPGDPGSVLLWLYRRVPDEAVIPSTVDAGLVARFRAFTFTD